MTPHDLVLTPQGGRFMGRTFPCSIGLGGITPNKTEGDGATPVGTHRIVGGFYRPDRMPCPAPWLQPALPGDVWCDESGHPLYNQHVRAPFDASHETLRRADPLYDLVLVTDYNWPDAKAQKGSAIFLHVWRRPRFPTAGCIAFSKSDLLWITMRIEPGARLIVPNLSVHKLDHSADARFV